MPANSAFLDAYGDVVAAVESGAGLPEVARATGRALDASVVIIDSASRVLAVACASPQDERAVLSGGPGTQVGELRVAATKVGELRYRARGAAPPATLVRMVGTLIGFEVERSRGPERASHAAVASFLRDLLGRKVTDRDNIIARAKELGVDLEEGATLMIVHAHPQLPEEGDWRARVLGIVERGARGATGPVLSASMELRSAKRERGRSHPGETVVIVPGGDAAQARAVAEAVGRELESSLTSYSIAVALSRTAPDPVDIPRAGAEALLAANVAQGQGSRLLAFEETGAYRLLLPAMNEDPAELQRFHDETVAPLIAYDEQYETDLLKTLESFLEADANVAKTAQKLFTHRHTIRYRLERIRELSGLDVGSTDGRERLGLGLKAMRVLGIASPEGPAAERGTEAGQVPVEGKEDLTG
ncbi:MAG: hypothetical protein NVS2B6_13230 [Thermoleophilaceae bacterium]